MKERPAVKKLKAQEGFKVAHESSNCLITTKVREEQTDLRNY